MPFLPMGAADKRLMSLVHSSVAQSTWSNHGKAWEEWIVLVVAWAVEALEVAQLEVTSIFCAYESLGSQWQ